MKQYKCQKEFAIVSANGYLSTITKKLMAQANNQRAHQQQQKQAAATKLKSC